MGGGPGEGGVDVGALRGDEREVLGLRGAAHSRRGAVGGAANHAACAANARCAIPASVIASTANARMLSSSW